MAFFRLWQSKGGAKAGFRVMLEYFEIKKAFRYYIKQIDSMLPCVWYSNRSQKTPKCGKNISDTLGYASFATFLFLPRFDVICDLLLNRRTATWNLFVKCTWVNFKEPYPLPQRQPPLEGDYEKRRRERIPHASASFSDNLFNLILARGQAVRLF